MIKKILSSFLVSSALFVFAATGAYADRPTFAIGYTAAYGGYEASGYESEGGSNKIGPQEISRANESGEYGYSSLFIEATFADRITVGASWMADEISTELSSRTDTILPGSAMMDATGSAISTLGVDPDGPGSQSDTGTSTVQAEFSNLVTGYIEVNIWNGLYAKYGIMEMDVETKENLHTDSSYPNTTMDGTTYGLGWKGSFDNGVFIKTETMMQEWTDLKLEATGLRTHSCVKSCTASIDNNNSINASLSGAIATISIGKAF